MLENLSGFIIQFIHSSGYSGIFILMLLGNSIIPFPSEIILPFSGFLVSQHALSFFLVVLAGAIGDVLGSLIIYAIGYFLEETVILSLINKYGKFVLITEHDFKKASSWFEKYGDKVVFFGKIIPGLRLIISLPAGIFRMNVWRFIIYAFLGALMWSFVLTYIGLTLGNHWNTLGGYFRKFELVVIIALVLAVIWYLNHKLHFFGKKK